MPFKQVFISVIGSYESESHHYEKDAQKVKEELLNFLGENDDNEETEMNTANNSTEAIKLINHYEEIISTQNKRVIQYIFKQGEFFKNFKDTEIF